MENKDSNSEEKLYYLLATKNFQSLSPDEKTFVLKHMSEIQYKNMFELQSIGTRALHEDRSSINAGSKIKKRLIAVMKEKNQKQAIPLFRIFTYRLPAYQLALSSVVLAICFTIVWTNLIAQTPGKQGQIVYQKVIDTLYIDRATDTMLAVADKKFTGHSLKDDSVLASFLVKVY